MKRFRGKAFWRQLLKSSATNNSIRVNIPSSLSYIRLECLVNTSLAKDNYKPFAFIACDWSLASNASQTANDYHSASQALPSASSNNKRFTHIDNNSPPRKKHVSNKRKPESTNPMTLSVFILWCNFSRTIPYVYRCARVFHDVTRLKARILVKISSVRLFARQCDLRALLTTRFSGRCVCWPI